MGWDRMDIAEMERWHEVLAQSWRQQAIIGAPDGMSALDLPHLCGVVLVDRGLWTVASIQKLVADDTIGDIPRIGKGREKAIREALAAWGQEHTAEKALEALREPDEDDDGGDDDEEEGED
jgi:hypothetical protein